MQEQPTWVSAAAVGWDGCDETLIELQLELTALKC